MPVKQSKRYNSAVKVADLTKEYPLKEAVEILAKFPKAKFDETVELSFRLGVDPAAGDQNVRGTTPLPNGSGKKVRVLVFTDDAARPSPPAPIMPVSSRHDGRSTKAGSTSTSRSRRPRR
jgi:ribosomal protein L1